MRFFEQFVPITLSEQQALQPRLEKHPHVLSGYTFAGLLLWEHAFSYRWLPVEKNGCLVACQIKPNRNYHLMQPLGIQDESQLEIIAHIAKELPYALKIFGVGECFLKQHAHWVEQFQVQEDRDHFDYVYKTKDLATLKGRKFARKRNHVKHGKLAHDWHIEPVTQDSLKDCRHVQRACLAEQKKTGHRFAQEEMQALDKALEHFHVLKQKGLLLKADNQPVGFALYEVQTPNTVAIHFERALRSFVGAHQILNQETAKMLVQQGLEFVNREEDLGILGLRRSKMSYQPAFFAKSHVLIFGK